MTRGFSDLGLGPHRADLRPDNEVSQSVAGRCGFVRKGVMRSHMVFKGGRRDTVIFSLPPGKLV